MLFWVFSSKIHSRVRLIQKSQKKFQNRSIFAIYLYSFHKFFNHNISRTSFISIHSSQNILSFAMNYEYSWIISFYAVYAAKFLLDIQHIYANFLANQQLLTIFTFNEGLLRLLPKVIEFAFDYYRAYILKTFLLPNCLKF